MKTFYDSDASLDILKNQLIAIIGYGIQGRAQALNLRDSGMDVIIGNIKDKYNEQASKDDFKIMNISEACSKASVIMVLIPDQAHREIYDKYIYPNLNTDNLLVFAHGYSIHFKDIKPPDFIDVCLLAPRMPGKPIREYFLNGGGVPAFIDVFQDSSGEAWRKVLSLAKGIGATRSCAMHVTFQEETEIDLFIEQFLLPLIIRGISLSFNELTKRGFSPEAVLMELYSSGEIGELLLMASKSNIFKIWEENASPTCQYGIFRNSEKIMPKNKTSELIERVLNELRDGSFINDLNDEAKIGYKN